MSADAACSALAQNIGIKACGHGDLVHLISFTPMFPTSHPSPPSSPSDSCLASSISIPRGLLTAPACLVSTTRHSSWAINGVYAATLAMKMQRYLHLLLTAMISRRWWEMGHGGVFANVGAVHHARDCIL